MRQRVKNSHYKDPRYVAQSAYGICHLCGLPIAPGQGSRDHVVPLRIDPRSVLTLPAHRRCNYRRGAGTVP